MIDQIHILCVAYTKYKQTVDHYVVCTLVVYLHSGHSPFIIYSTIIKRNHLSMKVLLYLTYEI